MFWMVKWLILSLQLFKRPSSSCSLVTTCQLTSLDWTGLDWPGLVWAGLDWISLDNYIKIYTGSSPARVPSNVTMLSPLLELASGDVTRGHQAKCKSHWPTLNVPCPVSHLHGYFSSFSSKGFPPAPFHMETLKHIQHVQGNFHNDMAGC